jgi:exosortase B
MSKVSEAFREELSLWLPTGAGLFALYIPTYVDVSRIFWVSEKTVHAPMILSVALYLLWRQFRLFRSLESPTLELIGVVLFAFGLLLYVLGRSQAFVQLEVLSQAPVLLGIAGVLVGKDGLKRLWFPVLILMFLVPIPGSILDQILYPLKQAVSSTVDTLLYSLGYPIGRSGALLIIGPYELMIADACSGLNSMVSLSAVGAIYIHLAGHQARWVNATLLLSILPIAFLANIVRVCTLVLVTYYLGDTAGRNFHDNAGILEIALVFFCFFLLDKFLTYCTELNPQTH